jgi:phosphomevalonate kinase
MQVSTPGKLILAGEYAVLSGAPGLVMAVDRRARVTLENSPDQHWHLRSVQGKILQGKFMLGEHGEPIWDRRSDRDDFALVDTILRNLDGLALLELPPFTAELDTSEFFDNRSNGQKLGLGSSAAVTVALVDALEHWAGKIALGEQEQLARLLVMHAQFQGGHGSGIDLAASLLGGVLEYRRAPGNFRASLIEGSLPKALHFKVVWSGRQASTPALLKSLESAANADPAGWRTIREDLDAGAEAVSKAFHTGHADLLLSAIEDYGDRLRGLQDFSHIPIFSPEHKQLKELASRLGLVYKPSGAGGGDLGLALGTDPGALAQFARQAELLGFRCPDLRLEKEGLLRQG